jgi:hypothetical protein
MNNNSLSKCYSNGTIRMHKATDQLYEDIHTDAGDPVRDEELIKSLCHEFLKCIREEIDFIRSACKESNEGKWSSNEVPSVSARG